MKVILDASALLAWLQDEPGAEIVEEVLSDAGISSLNWSEFYQKSLAHGVDVRDLRSDLEAVGLLVVPFDVEDAERAATLWQAGNGLSLADRACLALGVRQGIPVWTCDRAWEQAVQGVDVRVLRT